MGAALPAIRIAPAASWLLVRGTDRRYEDTVKRIFPFPKDIAALRSFNLREIAPFAIFFFIAAALFVFFKLAEEMLEGETRPFDEAVLRAMRNPADLADPVGPEWLETVFRDITALGSTTVLTIITVSAAGFLLVDRKRGAALFLLLAVAGGGILSNLMKSLFARPRPELVAHLVDVGSYSFPSGHAMASAATYLTLGILLARVQSRKRIKFYLMACALLLTFSIGASRVYLGVHWPTDVLAGWSLGAAWAMIAWQVASWLQRRGRIEKPGDGRN